jgi:hypothetical protein
MKTSDLSLVLSGFATVVAVSCLVFVRKQNTGLADRVLTLEAKQAKLEAHVDDSEKQTMQAMANELQSLCTELFPNDPGKCEPADAGEAPLYPAEMIAMVGKPETKGGEIHVHAAPDVLTTVQHHPGSLANDVSILPAVKDGKPAGYTLSDVRDGGLVAALGFRKGDVIAKIDGKPFTSSDEILAGFDAIGADAKKVTFDGTRDGKPLSVVVEISP